MEEAIHKAAVGVVKLNLETIALQLNHQANLMKQLGFPEHQVRNILEASGIVAATERGRVL